MRQFNDRIKRIEERIFSISKSLCSKKHSDFDDYGGEKEKIFFESREEFEEKVNQIVKEIHESNFASKIMKLYGKYTKVPKDRVSDFVKKNIEVSDYYDREEMFSNVFCLVEKFEEENSVIDLEEYFERETENYKVDPVLLEEKIEKDNQ